MVGMMEGCQRNRGWDKSMTERWTDSRERSIYAVVIYMDEIAPATCLFLCLSKLEEGRKWPDECLSSCDTVYMEMRWVGL